MPKDSSTHSTPTKKSHHATQNKSSYDRIGGEPNIKSAAKLFVSRLQKDSRTAKTFGSLDAEQQVKLVAGFIGHITGGPAYDGPSMYEFHRNLTLKDADFDAYLDILKGSLEDSDIESAVVTKIMAAVEFQRVDVLGTEKKGCKLVHLARYLASYFDGENAAVKIAAASLAVTAVAVSGYMISKRLRKSD